MRVYSFASRLIQSRSAGGIVEEPCRVSIRIKIAGVGSPAVSSFGNRGEDAPGGISLDAEEAGAGRGFSGFFRIKTKVLSDFSPDVSVDLGFGAPYVSAAIDGLGPIGEGGHTPEESLRLSTLGEATEAAVLIYRLTRKDAPNF